jgi:hypothetical protein
MHRSKGFAMLRSDRYGNRRRKPVRLRSSPTLWWCLTPLGWLGFLVAGFVLVATGLQLGRMFSDASALDIPAQFSKIPDVSHPCGARNPCFEKERYQPVWL